MTPGNGPVPGGLAVECQDLPGGKKRNCLSDTRAQVFLNQPQDDSVIFEFSAGAAALPGLYALQVTATGNDSTQASRIYLQILSGSLAVESSQPAVRASQGGEAAPSKATVSAMAEIRPVPLASETARARPGIIEGLDSGRPELLGGQPDLSISAYEITAWPRPARAGESVNVRIPVRNRGDGEAENVSLVLRIPAWSVEAREALSLAARESAVVEFTLDIPSNASLGDVAVELELHAGNRLADRRPENNRAIVRNLFAESSRGGLRDRAVLEFDAGACVGLRLDDGRVGECDGLNDLELQSDANGSLRLVAEAIGALGPIVLNRSVESVGSLSPQAALEAGTAYVVVRGSLRARLRVVRVQMVGAVPLRSPHGLPRPLDVPVVNDPHRLPTGSYKRDPSGLKPHVVVELEWERLSP